MLDVVNATNYQTSLPNRMSLTILLDLDDTLLVNPMEAFIPAYTQALGSHLAAHADPSRLIQQLLFATQMMLENDDPASTLETVFDRHFYPALDIERAAVQHTIDTFYAQEFPKLQPITSPKPGAAATVKELFERDCRVVIASNPVFPTTAITQRLSWADLPVSKFPFTAVPGYETFHFAKPHPAFFAELLGQIGWPDGGIIMVGNDAAMDISPAKEFGLATFWVTEEAAGNPETRHSQGNIDDLIDWIESTPEDDFTPRMQKPASILAALSAAPAALSSLTLHCSAQDWRARPGPDDWSLTEIVCHLRDVEREVNAPRLDRVLNASDPFIAGRDTDVWAKERNYQDQDGLQALEDFITYRKNNLKVLDAMDEQAWDFPARHAIFGHINLLEIQKINANHDRLHLQTVYQMVH